MRRRPFVVVLGEAQSVRVGHSAVPGTTLHFRSADIFTPNGANDISPAIVVEVERGMWVKSVNDSSKKKHHFLQQYGKRRHRVLSRCMHLLVSHRFHRPADAWTRLTPWPVVVGTPNENPDNETSIHESNPVKSRYQSAI